ncbi:hypothetical protein J6590_038339 [Homalodisca vitripennis]|nr:hypothetical protein J6590_038339 [Homalodisca vitripennis]
MRPGRKEGRCRPRARKAAVRRGGRDTCGHITSAGGINTAGWGGRGRYSLLSTTGVTRSLLADLTLNTRETRKLSSGVGFLYSDESRDKSCDILPCGRVVSSLFFACR